MFMWKLTCLILTISVFPGCLVSGSEFCNDTAVSNGKGFLTWTGGKLSEEQNAVHGTFLGYTIATTLNSTLSTKFQEAKQTTDGLKMSVCPVKENIRNVSPLDQFRASLMFLHQYLMHLEKKQEKEKAKMASFLFYSCDELNFSLKNATNEVCSFLGRLGSSGNVSVSLKSRDTRRMDIGSTLAIFQNFGECFMEKGLSFNLMKTCSKPVLSGCVNRRNKRRKGGRRKVNKGKGNRKGRKVKGNRKGRKGKKGDRKGKKEKRN